MRMENSDGRADFAFLVAIEIDPERQSKHHGASPQCLSQGDAEQMLSHLAADLGALLPDLSKCSIAAAGALYDQCQVLRPGTPLFTALAKRVKPKSSTTTARLTGVGFNDDGSEPAELAPDTRLPTGLLLMIPLLCSGEARLIDSLGEEMEHRFLGEGQVSAHTASWLQSAFDIEVGHARFMTLTDLLAMYRLQLEHFGYLPLWELVDAAVHGDHGEQRISTQSGASFHWRDGVVHAEFQTFDYWVHHGAGNDSGEATAELAKRYAALTREVRRYTSTLEAHHVPLVFTLPADCQGEVREGYISENTGREAGLANSAAITHHDWPDLGTIAISANTSEGVRHFYPLTAEGLNTIQSGLAGLALTGEGIAFPGTIRIDETTRRLRPARIGA